MSRLILLGKNIKKFRETKGFSQEVLAEKVDLSREYIVRVERGQKSLSLRKLFEICDILKIKCSDLINFD